MNRAQYLRRVGNNDKARIHEEYAEANYGFGGLISNLTGKITGKFALKDEWANYHKALDLGKKHADFVIPRDTRNDYLKKIQIDEVFRCPLRTRTTDEMNMLQGSNYRESNSSAAGDLLDLWLEKLREERDAVHKFQKENKQTKNHKDKNKDKLKDWENDLKNAIQSIEDYIYEKEYMVFLYQMKEKYPKGKWQDDEQTIWQWDDQVYPNEDSSAGWVKRSQEMPNIKKVTHDSREQFAKKKMNSGL